MLALALTEKTLYAMIFAITVVSIATFFDGLVVVDGINIACFVAIAVFFRRNVDLLSICCIYIAERGLEEVMWRITEYTLWFKVPFYLTLFLLVMWQSKGVFRLIFGAFFLAGMSIEAYWYISEYQAPMVMWHYYMLTINLLVRRLLMNRTFLLIELNPNLQPKPLVLDSQLILAQVLFISLNMASITEYWLRHLTEYNPLFVHSMTSSVVMALNLFILYNLVAQSIQHLRDLELRA